MWRHFPAWKCGDEVVHEGIKTAEYRRFNCRNFTVPAGSDGLYSAVYKRKEQPRCGYIWLSAVRGNIKADLRLHRVSGTGYADCTWPCRLLLGTKRFSAPCHVKKESFRYGKRAEKFYLRQSGWKCAGLCQQRHWWKDRRQNLRWNDWFCKIRL